MSIGYVEQFYCADCGTPLDYARKIDPVMYVRTQYGDKDYCGLCAADVIGPAVDAIFSIFELAPEVDEQLAVYSPFAWAAQ